MMKSKINMNSQVKRVALVLNMPTPYRNPVLSILSKYPDIELCVFFFSKREENREWDVEEHDFNYHYVNAHVFTYRGRYVHLGFGVWSMLREFKPTCVITGGFNPGHLISFMYSRFYNIPHIPMTDGTLQSEKILTGLHRLIRRIVYSKSSAFIGAGKGAFDLFRSYGINSRRMFRSHLCANNELFKSVKPSSATVDFIFCGRFVEAKNPIFCLDVAVEVAKIIGRKTSIVFVGSGELRSNILEVAQANAEHVDVVFSGFVQPKELPSWYTSAKILLIPSGWEPWGVVVNEAFAAGLPVISSSYVGAANDLIIDGFNGFILPLQVSEWTQKAIQLLSSSEMYVRFAKNAVESVREFSYKNAADGIAEAVRFVSN